MGFVISSTYSYHTPSGYIFRLRIPKDLQLIVGKTEFRYSLRSGFLREAKVKAQAIGQYDRIYKRYDKGAYEGLHSANIKEGRRAGTLHIVPLSLQALEVLREIQPLTGQSRYVFPNPRSGSRPRSDNAMLSALRRMGYAKVEMSGHGFRMAITLLNEQGWNRDAIERQLAHAERNSVRAAYNYAEFTPERKQMMQSWADYLDWLKSEQRNIK